MGCNRKNGNCPPKYKNIQTQSFGDEKRVTSEMLLQFCKNDAYLYEQVQKLLDKTDPETRKRFYPPYFMDSAKSYGVEPANIQQIHQSDYPKMGRLNDMYHLSNTIYEKYRVDFNYSNDKTYYEQNPNSEYTTLVYDNDNIIEDTSTLHIVAEENSLTDSVKYSVLPVPVSKEVTNEIPFKTYTTTTTVTTTTTNKPSKTTKTDVYGKLTLDANCSGPYKDWKANSVWYIGYNRHKNYNVKNAWRKNSDTYDIPSICRAQTFKAEHTGELRKVTMQMKGSSKSVSPCIVEIRTVKNGKPTTTVLARTEQKFNHSSKTMVNFTFKKPCKVTKGTSYAIVLRSPLSNFNHCYWISGWASTCFSNSRKRAYYDGDTFLSEDNGKTWILHGSKEKCYGSHYYDWGFAEAPVNFGFEVYIAPKTGTKTTAAKIPTTKTNTQTVTTSKTDYYTASATLNYYEKGDYYLEFKPFVGNFYTDITCVYTIDNKIVDNGANLNHGEYSWEIFNMGTGEWESFDDFAYKQGEPEKEQTSNGTEYSLMFSNALTFVKVRLKLTLEGNILADLQDDEDALSEVTSVLTEIGNINGEKDGESIINWIKKVYDEFLWVDSSTNTTSHTPLKIRQLKGLYFLLGKKPSFRGYLRTLEYHPVQEGMLPACIWAEVDADGVAKNDGNCKVDIVHEKTCIDRVLLYRADNLNLKPYIVDYETSVQTEQHGMSTSYETNDEIKNYVLRTGNWEEQFNKPFIDYLQNQTPKVYILPYVNGNDETTYFFGNEDFASIELDDYLAYPVNSCSIGTEDIHLNIKDTINNEEFSKYTGSNYISYTHNNSLTDNVQSVKVIYRTKDPNHRVAEGEDDDGEGDIETVVLELEENKDYFINDNMIVFMINKKSGEVHEPVLHEFITLDSSISLTPNTMMNIDYSEILIEMKSEAYNEFQHYLVDYDTKTLKFYHPLKMVEGEIKVNYNPLWCRDLEIGDFPLRMDLWTEYWQVNDDETMTFTRCMVDDCGKVKLPSTDDMIESYDEIKTKVAPLDNIRVLEVQDLEGNTKRNSSGDEMEMIEDIDYYVDYVMNTINFVTPEQKARGISNKDLSDGDIIMVKYTPNLTDNGLSLAYRLSRPLYLSGETINGTGLVDRSSYVRNSIEYGDDFFILSNYFTTRT